MTGYTNIQVAGGDTSRPINLSKRVKVIAESIPLTGARILDAGCGAGEYVESLCDLGAIACGIEYLPDKVAQWDTRHPGDTRVQQGDIEALPFDDECFDAAVMNEVLEHVPDEERALREIRRVLRPGGALLIFSPNRFYPFETHGVHSIRHGHSIPPLRTFLLPWVPVSIATRIVKPWARNYWPSDLRRISQSAGFRLQSHSFAWQTFENISGRRPKILKLLAPLLRAVAGAAERLPIIRSFGVSQVLVLRKPED